MGDDMLRVKHGYYTLIYKYLAMKNLFGLLLFVVLLGFASCGSDDDSDDCTTCTSSSYTVEICQQGDDVVETTTYSDGSTDVATYVDSTVEAEAAFYIAFGDTCD